MGISKRGVVENGPRIKFNPCLEHMFPKFTPLVPTQVIKSTWIEIYFLEFNKRLLINFKMS